MAPFPYMSSERLRLAESSVDDEVDTWFGSRDHNLGWRDSRRVRSCYHGVRARAAQASPSSSTGFVPPVQDDLTGLLT
jgi:hypothetical protein